jgi:hypothetical protein
MFAFLVPAAWRIGAKLLLGRAAANAKADLAAIPPKVKLALLGILLLVAGFFVHQHIAHKRIKAADAAGYARAKSEDAAAAKAIAARARAIEGKARAFTQTVEVHLAKDTDDTRALARDLRLRRPPGAQPVCSASRAMPGVPDAAGGGDGPAQGEVPGLAAVPWLELVDHGEQCDFDRAKLTALQTWINGQAAIHKPTP